MSQMYERTSAAHLTLWSSGLLSKWGFGDGDMPDDVFDWLEEDGIDPSRVDWRDEVLPALVRKYLLPVLGQTVEVYTIGTSHNPIRASSVNGVEVDATALDDDPRCALSPESVQISRQDVMTAIKRARVARAYLDRT